ncbi:MAG: YitT family protein, partial [Clostridia bacterium]|nr:YitT family protein [Clostridia bacterium]
MKTKGKLFLQLVTISLGCVAYASGLILFLNPNDLAPGGVSGVSIMLSRFIPVEVGTLILVFNIPLLITAFIKFGAKFTAMTAFATVLSSTIMDLLEAFLPPDYAVTRDKLLAGIFGGTLMALGMGVIFRAGGTTGGSDIIIRLLRRKFRHLKTSTIFLITDCIIVGISALVFGNIEAALYAGIARAVNSSVLDFVLYGSNGARMIFIVTEHPDE